MLRNVLRSKSVVPHYVAKTRMPGTHAQINKSRCVQKLTNPELCSHTQQEITPWINHPRSLSRRLLRSIPLPPTKSYLPATINLSAQHGALTQH